MVTDKVKADEETAQLMQMLDTMPINVMLMEPENFTITFVNQTSKDTLAPLQSLLPCPIDDLVGQCFDIFHTDPERQRALLSDPKNLPHTAKIKVGDETLSLRVSAVFDKGGNYTNAMLTWAVITEQVKLAETVGGVATMVSSAATEMQATAESMSGIAKKADQQVTAVASASEELTSSIKEISQQVTRSATIATSAVEEQGAATQEVTTNITGVSETSAETGQAAEQILEASAELSKQSDNLDRELKEFLEKI